MHIAILGAGCGGHAIAGYIASKGYKINLYNRSPERLSSLKKNKEIRLQGLLQSVGKLNLVTSDISEAIKGVKLIMVVTTATGHPEIARNIAPILKDGQIIVLNPGRTFGSLEFMNTLLKNNLTADVSVAEANTLIYATRTVKPGLSNIKGIKKTVSLSVIPTHHTPEVVSILKEIYPQFYGVSNILTTSLGNIGAVFHPTITLFNKKRIKKQESFDFYVEGVTREVVEYMEVVDNERREIARRFGVEVQSLRDWLCERYGIQEDNLYDALHSNPFYKGIDAPKTLNMRYLTEDIPTGLVPFSELGKAVGIKTKHIDELISMASKELQVDFRSQGRNLYSLGLNSSSIFENLKEISKIKKLTDYKGVAR